MALNRRKPEPSWRLMKRLEKSLQRELRADGVGRIEYVIAFSEPFTFWVWLGTETDHERDNLQADPAVEGRIRSLAADLNVEHLYEGYTVESQQTVDRDYDGSWFYRLR